MGWYGQPRCEKESLAPVPGSALTARSSGQKQWLAIPFLLAGHGFADIIPRQLEIGWAS